MSLSFARALAAAPIFTVDRQSSPACPQGAMASADLCAFRTALFRGCGRSSRRVPRGSPRTPRIPFPPSARRICRMRLRIAIGLRHEWRPCPRMRPSIRFLFARPEVCPWFVRSCIRLPLRAGRPCLRPSPSRCRADQSPPPFRNARRRHSKNFACKTLEAKCFTCDFHRLFAQLALCGTVLSAVGRYIPQLYCGQISSPPPAVAPQWSTLQRNDRSTTAPASPGAGRRAGSPGWASRSDDR